VGDAEVVQPASDRTVSLSRDAARCERASFSPGHIVHYGLLGFRFRGAGIELFAPVLASMPVIVV
jgi:hypothetical protein